MGGGHEPDGPEATAMAERHRAHIDRWFYPCPPQMHAGLAQMYVADARFKEYWDKHADGLAEYVKAAIEANASEA